MFLGERNMSVYKIITCDIKEGIFKNKRNIIIPLLCTLQCMYAHLNINMFKEYNDIKGHSSLLDLFAEIFHGCDPVGQNISPDIKIIVPYLWFSIFVFAVFISFDYMHNDLTQFGMQILSRTSKRRFWWISKCAWCYLSSIWFYLVFTLTAFLFAVLNNYDVFDVDNVETINVLADRSVIYNYIGISELSLKNILSILLMPLIVISTLNILQMLLCLFIKPMYGYLLIIGIVTFGIISDSLLAISRTGMVTFNNMYFENAYNEKIGLIICVLINIICVVTGTIYFKKYDIIPSPDKE